MTVILYKNHSWDLHLMAYMYVGRMGITVSIATNLLYGTISK